MEVQTYNIYKVKIHEITLRELLIMQSFYLCKTQGDIVKLVAIQPYPQFFYKSFLELDTATMVSILAFDSGSMSALLGDQNSKYFSAQYPIIFKNKILKKSGKNYYYRTAFDNAIRNNQVEAINKLIKYIITYQNNYVSASLFFKQIPILMEKGISLKGLFDSSVFTLTFDFDEWPSTHPNNLECSRPYIYNIFEIRDKYPLVFPEKEFEVQDPN